MTKQKYNIDHIWEGQYGEEIHFEGIIELDNEVIKSVDDEWRKVFYSGLRSEQDIAEHLAFNIIVNNANLSMLDGFANFPDDFAKIIRN